MNRLQFLIPSYGRAGHVKAHRWLPSAYIVVPMSQRQEYRKQYPGRVVEIEDKLDGWYGKKYNALLDLADGDCVIADDDFDGLVDLNTNTVLSPGATERLLINGQVMARDLGAGMWGFTNSADPMKYRSFHPFSLTKSISWVTGVIKDELRHDPKFKPPQFGGDMDFWLQKVQRYRKVFRFNRYFPKNHVGKAVGGIGVRREDRHYDYLVKKWGETIVSVKPGGFLGLHPPLSGV